MNSIEDIKNKYSIIDIARRLGLEVSKDNKTICPFHNDSNPSLSFNKNKNYYHCFSCGAGGDNIKLVMEVLHCSFREAIEFITGEKINKKIKKIETSNDYNFNDNQFNINIYKDFINMLSNEDAIEYLKKRKITEEQINKRKIKNLPKDKENQNKIIEKLLKVYNENELINSGIILKKYNKLYLLHYNHRLLIPYFDMNGKQIISIQGRNIDDKSIKPKYLFNKNAKDSIYNIDTLTKLKSKDIVLCEGVIDCLSLERLGYNSISISGASKFNLLKNYNIIDKFNIYLFADNDEAGTNLTKSICKYNNFKGIFDINAFSKEKVKDINELLNKVEIKYFSINNKKYKYFEMPNDKICILDYYVFDKLELKNIKKENFEEELNKLIIKKRNK